MAMDKQLPALEWLQQTNLKLASEGVLPEKRQYQAFRMWCMESGQSMGLGGELSKYISDWFAANTLSASMIGRSSARTVFYFDMSFIELSIPLVFGEVEFPPVDMIRNVPKAVVEQIAANDKIQHDLVCHYQMAYNCFVALAGISPALPTQADKKLAKAAYKHLIAACAQLLESPPNPKALQDCRFAVEIALKALLVNKLGVSEEVLKFKLGHNFNKIFNYAELQQVDMPVTLEKLSFFPDVGARYEIIDIDRALLWQGYSVGLLCLNHAVEQIEIANPLLG